MNSDHSVVRHIRSQESETAIEVEMLPHGVSKNRLTSKYLWLSLLVALIPLIGFASLYDSYFSQLVTRLTEEQLATRVAATQNEFRVFIRERKFEIQSLTDQFDSPEYFVPEGRQNISSELESFLRLQVDARSVYGVVFFDEKGEVAWSFPDKREIGLISKNNVYEFEGAELIGPSAYSIERPSGVVLRTSRQLNVNTDQKGSIGLVLRFNSFTEILHGLDQGTTFRVLLKAGDGNTYDVVGQPVNVTENSVQKFSLLPGWSLQVIQDRELVMSPVERMRYWLILLMIFTVAGLFWLHMSISRRLNRQVESLIDSVEQVALGNLEAPVAHVQGMEMLRLTQSIERMRLQLKKFIRSTLAIERQATLGQLAAGLAHDIRNPLTTIRTTVAALSRREKNPENKEMMSLVEEEIDRVNYVLENLLNFARPRDPLASRIDAKELLSSVVALVGASARNQNIELRMQCPPSMFLIADEGHVRQVLMNLLLNALEAMSVQGDLIALDGCQKGAEIALSVRDNGQGMPEDILAHIMEPFYTTKSAGTGLGLAICNTLIKSNGGRMSIESTKGEGTTVTVFLPVAEAQE
ncbi:sensor histidine kinase [Neptuniibacter marinus]|uniref:sensor histidine kinase n=1 Tax=Neptuniibacter marinus TaxID=1806670 RepID=UPI00082B92DA|nr:ATP-binding protein [Neptuniibacter marinus]